MSHPLRIQRKRTKGYRLPKGAICCTRPGRWGNPFRLGTRVENVDAHKNWLFGKAFKNDGDKWIKPPTLTEICQHLRGKQLACFCPLDGPCHVDTLAEIANAEAR